MNARSEKNLIGVHPDLARVIRKTAEICPFNFVVTEGVRSLGRQIELIRTGMSRLKDPRRGRHVSGHAVDLCVIIDGVARWDLPVYRTLATLVKNVAAQEKVDLEWGGEAFGPGFVDGPHFQLTWKSYPIDLSPGPNDVNVA